MQELNHNPKGDSETESSYLEAGPLTLISSKEREEDKADILV